MASLGKIARRTFLFGAAAIAGGAAFGYYYYRKPYANPLEGELAEGEATFNPFVKIASDNTITVIAPRAEMGQGVSTTLAALVAEELDVGLDRIKVEHGPADLRLLQSPDAGRGRAVRVLQRRRRPPRSCAALMGAVGKILGLQGTGGSSSTRDGYVKMREAGAATRAGADRGRRRAARRARPATSSPRTARSCTRPPGKSVTYGELGDRCRQARDAVGA